MYITRFGIQFKSRLELARCLGYKQANRGKNFLSEDDIRTRLMIPDHEIKPLLLTLQNNYRTQKALANVNQLKMMADAGAK